MGGSADTFYTVSQSGNQTACNRTWDSIACGDVLFIGVHGSIEGPDSTNLGLANSKTIVKTCESFEKEASKKGRKIDVELLDYTAPNWDGWDDIITASGLKDTGRNELDMSIQNALTHCPMREIVLAGYSFGAWIIDDWLSRPENSADLPRIRGVQLYGDPLWRSANPGYQGLASRMGQAVNPDPYTSNPIGPPGLGDRWGRALVWMKKPRRQR